jgi:hypothetical protein
MRLIITVVIAAFLATTVSLAPATALASSSSTTITPHRQCQFGKQSVLER